MGISFINSTYVTFFIGLCPVLCLIMLIQSVALYKWRYKSFAMALFFIALTLAIIAAVMIFILMNQRTIPH